MNNLNKMDCEKIIDIVNAEINIKGINGDLLKMEVIDNILNKEPTYDDFIYNLDKINDIPELEDDQILKLKEKLKEIELKLKNKSKPKTIAISGEAHNIIKKYCLTINENIGEWSEKMLINLICLPAKSEQKVYLIDYNTHSVGGKLYQCHSWVIENDINKFLYENRLKGDFYLYYKESINIDPTTLGASNFKTKITGFFA